MTSAANHTLRLIAVVALALGAGCGASKKSCDPGLTACGDACVDTNTDPQHCGDCLSPTSVCPARATCTGGACVCPAGQTACNGACVDLATDANNCGTCGLQCGLGTCSGGACSCQGSPVIACSAGNPRCVNPTSDPKNCNGCGNVCPLAGEACQSSTCACPSTAPTQCPASNPTACVNTATDAKNCGGCGKACPANETCGVGICSCSRIGFTVCNQGTASESCSNLQSDRLNCGSCGHACTAGQVCSAGQCTVSCPTGQTTCNGACVNTATDAANCGSCGKVCATGLSCVGGQCGTKQCGTTICQGGTQCCTGADGPCQHPHVNGSPASGLGQTYYDCQLKLGDPSDEGSYTQTMASEAASAWAPDGSPTVAVNGFCVARLKRDRTICAQWCWSGGSNGYGSINLYGGSNLGCTVLPGPFDSTRSSFTWD